jgi:hypothetical protein
MSDDQKLSKEDQQRKTNQIFNIAERPVMDFISSFMEAPVVDIFKDEIPTYTEPLILLPISDYKDGVCIKFTIRPINLSDEHPENLLQISSIIHHTKVKEGVGFLWYCIKEAYTAIVATAMHDNKPLVRTTMDLNESDWVFYPRYANELTHKKNFLENALGKLMYIKQNTDKFPPDVVEKINIDFPRITEQLTAVNRQITPEIVAEEKKMNALYSNKPVLGIFVEEMLESDLPEPILSKDDELKKKNITNITDTNTDDTNDVEQSVANLFISD